MLKFGACRFDKSSPFHLTLKVMFGAYFEKNAFFQILLVAIGIGVSMGSPCWAKGKRPSVVEVRLPTEKQCEESQVVKKKYMDWRSRVRATLKPYQLQFNEACLSEKKIGTWQDRNDPLLNQFPGIRDVPWVHQNACYNPADSDATPYFKNEDVQTDLLRSWEEEKKECSLLQNDFNKHTQFHMNRQILLRRFFLDELKCDFLKGQESSNSFQNCKNSIKNYPKVLYAEAEIAEWQRQYAHHVRMTDWFIAVRRTRFFDCPLNWIQSETFQLWERCHLIIKTSKKGKGRSAPRPERAPEDVVSGSMD